MNKLWNTPLNRRLKTTREVRRIIIDHNLPAGWPIKWGHQYDIPINGVLVSTGESCLNWTGQQWIDFINKNLKQKLL